MCHPDRTCYLGFVNETNSEEDCQSKCAAKEGCKYWIYQKSLERCHFKKSLSGMHTNKPDLVSGPVKCEGM